MTARARVRTTNIAGHRPRRRSRSAASESPMYVSATGTTTMAPSAATTKRMPPTVKRCDIAFSFTKPRSSSERDPEAHQKCEPEGLRTPRGDVRELLPRDIDGAAGQNSGDLIEVP